MSTPSRKQEDDSSSESSGAEEQTNFLTPNTTKFSPSGIKEKSKKKNMMSTPMTSKVDQKKSFSHRRSLTFSEDEDEKNDDSSFPNTSATASASEIEHMNTGDLEDSSYLEALERRERETEYILSVKVQKYDEKFENPLENEETTTSSDEEDYDDRSNLLGRKKNFDDDDDDDE